MVPVFQTCPLVQTPTSRSQGGLEYSGERTANPDSNDDIDDDNTISNSIECYACTQVGVPVFHSTSCDRSHQPEWEASAGSSLIPIRSRSDLKTGRGRPNWNRQLSGPFGHVLDPRSKRVQRWNRAFLLARAMALAIDPLFFYALSIGRGGTPCLYMDGGLAAIVTILRTCVGRRASVPLVASVSVGVRVKGVIGGRLWEACVGRTCDCFTLCAVSQGLLVRRLRDSSPFLRLCFG
ncbi:hypothetical protein F0562_004367 [Nyssa sinensis]|uniref:Uncharacterized protein n=1 Tax=Nyssa sinensis TaxID=561372 RepID=A0A5J5BYC1_9ASTE|nr:hypothetical protein F0562_004367 [Nyssa sinensis]